MAVQVTTRKRLILNSWAYLWGLSVLTACTSQTVAGPPAPSSLQARPASSNEIRVHWVESPGSYSGTSIERCTGRQGIFTEIASISKEVSIYNDSGLNAASTYCYRARAFMTTKDYSKYSAYSNVACATTLGAEVPPSPLPANEFYVAPAGSPMGNGSVGSPWDLQTALNHPASVMPGDTIWLRRGTYRRLFVSYLRGEAGKSIVVRSFPGEWVKLDGSSDLSNAVLTVKNPYVIFMEMEIMRSDFNRYQNTSGCGRVKGGVNIHAANVKFINCVVHDTSLGITAFSIAPNAELYGNIVYYNGWIDVPDNNKACDHGIYGHNQEGYKIIKDNIVFQNFSTGITPHGTSAAFLNNVELEGNIVFSNGSIRNFKPNPGWNIWFGYWGGSTTPRIIQNPKIIDNYTYCPQFPRGGGSLALNYSTSNAVVTRNYWIGGLLHRKGSHSSGFFGSNVIIADTYSGNWTPSSEPKDAYYSWNNGSLPVAAIVRRNQYDPKRAHLVVYNFRRLDSVKVDISDLGWKSGDVYELRNVQDYFGDIISRTYSGNGTIIVPMTSRSVARPVGWPAPATTFPEFGAFVLFRKSGT